MFRRGQARVGLRRLAEAKDDFERVLAIEPANGAAKAELEKVGWAFEEAARAESAPKQKREPVDIPVPPLASGSSAHATPAKPKRRRVPIEIVDGPAPSAAKTTSVTTAKPTDDLMTPVSSRPLPTSPSPASTPPSSAPAPQSKTFQEAKEARTAAKPGVGGGIFRPNGKHTIFGEKEKQAASPPAAPTPSNASTPSHNATAPVAAAPQGKANGLLRKPRTLFEFSREWEKRETAEDRWALLNEILPTALPSLFQSSLEAELLTGIVDALRDVLVARPDEDTRGRVREYMVNLARVQRFSTVVLFMSADEKKSAKEVWELLGGEGEKAWGVS